MVDAEKPGNLPDISPAMLAIGGIFEKFGKKAENVYLRKNSFISPILRFTIETDCTSSAIPAEKSSKFARFLPIQKRVFPHSLTKMHFLIN